MSAFGLDVLAMTGLLTLAANPVTCTVPQAPVVNIVPKSEAVIYDTSKSLEELNVFKADTISPYGNHTEQMMFGMHQGILSMQANTGVGGVRYPALGVSCLYYDEITVNLTLSPKIYIINEMKPGSCEYKAVLEHEMKHLKADRRIVNKYARVIGEKVQEAVNAAGAMGPYKVEEVPERQQRMADHISNAVKSVELLMYEEQDRMQQAVDSLEEYNRITDRIRNKCRFRIEEEAADSVERMFGNSGHYR